MFRWRLLQLLTALECDSWIGSREADGWARLVDQLRCTWLPKCRQPYLALEGLTNS